MDNPFSKVIAAVTDNGGSTVKVLREKDDDEEETRVDLVKYTNQRN